MSKKKISVKKFNAADYQKTICSHITDFALTSIFFLALTILVAFLGVTSETPSQRNGILCFVTPFLFLIAAVLAANAFRYLPIFKETKKIKNATTTQVQVQVTKIKKKYYIARTYTAVSVFVIYFTKNRKTERLYYIPLHPMTNTSVKHLNGQDLCMELYNGTKIIKAFSSEIVQTIFD